MPKHMSLAETFNKREIQEIINATDQCVLCGLCLPHCPTYSIAQNEAESPRGRIALIRALYEEQLTANDTINMHIDQCLTCMSCEQVCPANVDYEKIIDAGRVITRKQQNPAQHVLQSLLLLALSKLSARRILKALNAGIYGLGLQRLLPKKRLFNLLPGPHLSRFNITKNVTNENQFKTKVAIINSCAGDLVNDETYAATKFILSKLGCDVLSQNATLCCGALHQHIGDPQIAKKLRQKFTNAYKNQNLDYLISLAMGCGAQIKRYPVFDDASETLELAGKLIDVNEFVLLQLMKNKLAFASLAKTVFLHKPCSQPQIVNDMTAIEQLLNFIPNIKVLTFQDEQSCCGAGGMNTLSHNDIAEQLIDNKILELKNSSASYLLSSNIGCQLHFQARIKQDNLHIEVCHPITLLAQQVI
jgi:glycolate oxidase iron-sulfur subunit